MNIPPFQWFCVTSIRGLFKQDELIIPEYPISMVLCKLSEVFSNRMIVVVFKMSAAFFIINLPNMIFVFWVGFFLLRVQKKFYVAVNP
jgi:hypothetical protein